jgi:hypothetical protein
MGPVFRDKKIHIKVLRYVILSPIAHPVSKLATQQIPSAHFGREVDLDCIYPNILLRSRKDCSRYSLGGLTWSHHALYGLFSRRVAWKIQTSLGD